MALATEGAVVAALDVDGGPTTAGYPLATAADLAETASLVERAGGTCLRLVADIRKTAEVERAVEATLAEFGRIDVLVANAGVCASAPFGEIGEAAFRDVVDTNLSGTFRCLRAVLRPMRSQGYGRIIVVSSMTGRHGNAHLAHYCASKFAVIGLAKSLALEVAREGITVNVMCPTSADTPMIHNEANYRLFCPDVPNPTIDDVRPRFAALNPMQVPWIDPAVFTKAVVFLACDPGTITGATLEVGAGLSALLT